MEEIGVTARLAIGTVYSGTLYMSLQRCSCQDNVHRSCMPRKYPAAGYFGMTGKVRVIKHVAGFLVLGHE